MSRPNHRYDLVLLLVLIALSITAVSVTALKRSSTPTVTKPVTVTKKADTSKPTDSTPAKSTATKPPTTTPLPTPMPTKQPAASISPSYIVTNRLCQVDATQAPDQLSRAQEMARVCQTVFPEIEARLTPAPYGPPHQIVLDHNQYAAYASGNSVHVSIDWLRNSPYDPGVIPHELTHVIQSYPAGPSWVTEGIATYMSYKLKYSIGIAHCNGGERYTSGYGCAASLFNYIERRYQPAIIRHMHATMKANTYSDSLFQTETGKSLSTLYSECLTAECQGGTP